MELNVTLGIDVEGEDRAQLEARKKLLEEASELIADEQDAIMRLMNPLAAHIERWEERARLHELVVSGCKADEQYASPDKRIKLKAEAEYNNVQFRFWQDIANRARTMPEAMRSSAIREISQHSMLRDLWQTVLEELGEQGTGN